MSNVANAIGPLISGGILSSFYGLVLGGIALGIGAVVFGHRVLETGAKRFTQLNIVTGSVVNTVSGGLVLIAALLGIPVPLVQSTSAGILGIAYVDQGSKALTKSVVRDMLTIWVVSPVVSLSVAYVLAHMVLDKRLMETQISSPLLLISAAIVGTALLFNRRRLVRRLSQAILPLLRLVSASIRFL